MGDTMNYKNLLMTMIGLTFVSLLFASCDTLQPSPASAPDVPTSTPAPEATIPISQVETGIDYANVEGLATKLDGYTPSEEGSWPVVIVAHGMDQSRFKLMRLAKAIASEGAVVYNIDVAYSFPFITGVERIACAVRFARATAVDYGGDPSQIILVGYSAGAVTGAVVGLAGDDFEEGCAVTDASALPDAMVLFEGPYDYTVKATCVDHTVLEDTDPEVWEAVNPYSHIGRNPDLQVRLLHGDDNDTACYDILPQASIDFHQALAEAGYDLSLIHI